MDGEDLYDEFGNYIGPDINDEDDSDSESGSGSGEDEDGSDEDQIPGGLNADDLALMDPNELRDIKTLASKQEKVDQSQNAMAVVLHEDKNYYPSHSQVYGPDVEIVIQIQI